MPNEGPHPQGLPNSSTPGHVPPTILPLHRKARGAISELHWIYGTAVACIRNYDQSTGTHSQVYTHEFPGTNDKLLTIQIPYQSQTIKSTTKIKMINLHRIVAGYPSQENNTYLNENPPEPIPHIRNTPQSAPKYPYSSNRSKDISVQSVPFWSCLHKKNTKRFGYTTLFNLNLKTQFKITRGKGLRIQSRTTAGGSSPFPWSVPEVDAVLRSLSALPIGTEEASTAPLETNLSSRFQPSLSGRKRHPLRPVETNLSSHF